MILQSRNFLSAALLALATFSTPSLAQEAGWYAGLGLGQAKYKGACTGVSGPGFSCSETDAAFKFLGGYQINKNFAVEIGYADLGEALASRVGVGSAAIAASGFEALAVFNWPIAQKWSWYAKLGFFRWDMDLIDKTGGGGSASASGTDLTSGFGVKYSLAENVALRVEYQVYRDVGDANTTDQGDISLIGGSVIYRF